MRDVELQQDLQRYAAQFTETVTEAMVELERSPDRRISDEALRRNVAYASAAIDIAIGPFPEVNLLDMIVFVRLSRSAADRYWVPEVYGADAGTRLVDAFQRVEQELWRIADRALDGERKNDVLSLADDWLADNPGHVRVEGVRLTDFSAMAGEAARGRADRARGLLSSVRSATQSADQALLLAEQAMFLAHRIPFLVRMQARIAAREIVSDAVDRLLLGRDAPLFVLGRRIAARVKRGTERLRLHGQHARKDVSME
jgi:hypothetical protein